MHKEIEIILKTGDKISCDIEISPLVKWFNSLDNVLTYASCQGDIVNGIHAYVHFSVSDNYSSLVYILKELSVYYYRENVVVEVGYNPVIPQRNPILKYTLYIKNIKTFKSIMDFIKSTGDK